jgi:transcriptional regulator with XRE-family HTH domain
LQKRRELATMCNMNVAGAIRALRASMKLTQGAFAKKMGISHGSVAHYEILARHPEAATLARFIRAACNAERLDLAEVFAGLIPGVKEGIFIPAWRIPGHEKSADESAGERQATTPDRNVVPVQLVPSPQGPQTVAVRVVPNPQGSQTVAVGIEKPPRRR